MRHKLPPSKILVRPPPPPPLRLNRIKPANVDYAERLEQRIVDFESNVEMLLHEIGGR